MSKNKKCDMCNRPKRRGSKFCEEHAKQHRSKTQWKDEGRTVRTGAAPTEVRHGRHSDYPVFAIDQTDAIVPRRVIARPLQISACNVALALYEVNKAAKRQRDAAGRHYHDNRHGFARYAKEQKMYYYDLKLRTLQVALQRGWASITGLHVKEVECRDDNDREDDGVEKTVLFVEYYALYKFSGYRFHQPVKPDDAERLRPSVDQVINLGAWLADAKPQGKMRMTDAVATLQQFLDEAMPATCDLT